MDMELPFRSRAAASAASHASTAARSSIARSVTGGSQADRNRPKLARWPAIALTVAGARVAAACVQ